MSYPGHVPPKNHWAKPAAIAAASGLLVGGLFTGLIVNANNQARIDHCQDALATSMELTDIAVNGITAYASFDFARGEAEQERLGRLDADQYAEDTNECRGA